MDTSGDEHGYVIGGSPGWLHDTQKGLSGMANCFSKDFSIQCATITQKTKKIMSIKYGLLKCLTVACERGLLLERGEWKLLSPCILKGS